jgi:hypothetical protein
MRDGHIVLLWGVRAQEHAGHGAALGGELGGQRVDRGEVVGEGQRAPPVLRVTACEQ